MATRWRSHASDLRGAARLATDATAALADLVEAMHARIARIPGGEVVPARTRGVTGFVYRSVRGVTRLVGGGLDLALGALTPALALDAASPQRDAVVAALNGVLGDHLAATDNPLATPMQWRHGGRTLALEREALAAALPRANGRVLVLLHGLCMNDRQWARNGHDHGQALHAALGVTPVYLRYNTGLHVSVNARALAQQLELLAHEWPAPLERIVLLGHSMGGLLARSALHHAADAGHRWPAHVSDLVCLGTPHHGAPLERAGQWFTTLLGASTYAGPLARLGRLRSAGITDLRHGNLLDADRAGDRFTHAADRRTPVPLPRGVRCFAAAATLGRPGADLKGALLGDGLVPLDSALGRHHDPALALAFPEAHQWVGSGLNHFDLLGRVEVAQVLVRWLGGAPATEFRPALPGR